MDTTPNRRRRLSRTLHHLAVAGAIPTVSAGLLLVQSSAAQAGIDVTNKQPPGVAGFQTLLNWGGWIVTVVGVVGLLAVGAQMILQHRRGEGGEHVGRLGMVLTGLLVAVAAGPLVNALDK